MGAHQLNDETKLIFCDILYSVSKEREDELKKAQICFVGQNTNDKLYAFISRPKLFNVIKK